MNLFTELNILKEKEMLTSASGVLPPEIKKVSWALFKRLKIEFFSYNMCNPCTKNINNQLFKKYYVYSMQWI